MKLDYFYGKQAEQFSFYRIPKALFTEEQFKSISAEAKILYGILLDRISLSQKNGWFDERNRVYIIFTLEEVMAAMGCADNKASKLLAELDKKAGLIERKRQGLGKPNLIFVKNFVGSATVDSGVDRQESRIQSRENHDSGVVETTIQDSLKSRGTKTNDNKTEYNDTDIYPSPFPSGQGEEEGERIGEDGEERRNYQAYFERQLELAVLIEEHPNDREVLEEILSLLVDTVCSRRQYIRIAGDDKPREVVKSQLLKLNAQHIEYVLSSCKENVSRVRNIKQYLLASLYNAPMTIASYYDALVRHNRAGGYG